MLDVIVTPFWNQTFKVPLEREGVQSRVFNPMPWPLAALPAQGYKSLQDYLQDIFRLHRRNHRKTCLIDRKRALLGSRNICQDHLESFSGDDAWRDTSVLV